MLLLFDRIVVDPGTFCLSKGFAEWGDRIRKTERQSSIWDHKS